ncbi:hypothetical protein L2E82_11064 [Cichorium intybus]|uniref:Uncharacterized protein n=1 Tax=Cichorium intybus TaxID=13427 RepID=A0ACB9GCB7_CICIN|nr:hypothetical protein L2E82_11064 [Cichorium intybus]
MGLARCARFLKKCLDFLDQPDQLVVRAFAHYKIVPFVKGYNNCRRDQQMEQLGIPTLVFSTKYNVLTVSKVQKRVQLHGLELKYISWLLCQGSWLIS